jgi:hypothetical protein
MMGSTPIDRKIFGSIGRPFVAGICDPATNPSAPKTDLKGKKLPAKGRTVNPLIMLLLFIKSKFVNMILKICLIIIIDFYK